MPTPRRGYFSTLATSAIGGVLFLLPIFVIGGMLAYVYGVAADIYHHIKPWFPFDSATGVALVFGIAVLLLLVCCFFAGLMAEWAIGRHFTKRIERQLIKLYPKYAIHKDILAGTLGGDDNVPSLSPVVVRRDDEYSLALEADRLANGLVIVYFPGAPDAWSGTVGLVDADRVRPIDLTINQVVELSERLGRDCGKVLDEKY